MDGAEVAVVIALGQRCRSNPSRRRSCDHRGSWTPADSSAGPPRGSSTGRALRLEQHDSVRHASSVASSVFFARTTSLMFVRRNSRDVQPSG